MGYLVDRALAVVSLAVLAQGFVLVSSPAVATGAAAAGPEAEAARLFEETGRAELYSAETTVLLNEARKSGAVKDVGFHVTMDLEVGAVWSDPTDDGVRLLKLQVREPQLHIKSRKAPSPEGFVAHSSRLSELRNGPFLALWERGSVPYVWLAKGEDLSLVNLKKGLASIFQFKIQDWESTEKDASGKCMVKYERLDAITVLKTKRDCVNGKHVPFIEHPDPALKSEVTSDRSIRLALSPDLTVLEAATATETHEMVAAAREEAGATVRASLELTRKGATKVGAVTATSLEEAVRALEKETGLELHKQILVTDREASCQDDCPSLSKLVKEQREALSASSMGSLRSAAAFTRLLPAVREASKDDIVKVLKSSKNKHIQLQLCDLVGAAQTMAAHEAAMKVLRVESDEDFEASERYFTALSFGSHPVPSVVKDVLKRSELPVSNPKLKETLLLTVGAMANKLRQLPIHRNHKVVEEAQSSLLAGLEACADDGCRQTYLRALRNLASESTLPVLLNHAQKGGRRASVAALHAVKALPRSVWRDATVVKTARRVFLQSQRPRDSSARTLAADLLLEAGPDAATLDAIVPVIKHAKDGAHEVRQYVWQRVHQLGEEQPTLAAATESCLRRHNASLLSYDARAQRGVSSALTRRVLSHASANASLSSVQEAAGGLLKRGAVDVRLHKGGHEATLFSLGLFAGGLGSFVSSGEEDQNIQMSEEEPEEEATAGMELAVLGVALRPFVFFSGQGELMGHVWSGTASERTPAFQVLTLLQDHQQSIPLQPGFVAELTLTGAVSFDLAGQIQLSLWNRNAKSLVEKNVALLLQGLMRVDSSFVRSQVLFHVATEPRLLLSSDIDFYDRVALCLKLQQPNSVLRHNVYKVERIPGSKHRLRKSKYQTANIPGKTYSLNRKNNEMCNMIFSNK